MGGVRALAVVQDGARALLALGGGDRTIRLWDPATGKSVGQWLAPVPALGILAFGDSAQNLAVYSRAVAIVRINELLHSEKQVTRLLDPSTPDCFVDYERRDDLSGIVVTDIGRNATRTFTANVLENDECRGWRPLEDVVGIAPAGAPVAVSGGKAKSKASSRAKRKS